MYAAAAAVINELYVRAYVRTAICRALLSLLIFLPLNKGYSRLEYYLNIID